LKASESATTTGRARYFSGQRLFLLLSLSLGHTLMHCFQQGWYIILPSIKDSFGLNPVQYGAIESTRSISGGVINLPAGAASDLLRKRWVPIIASALVGLGLAYFLLGIASNYLVILVAAALIGISTALWHPPALSVVSARLSERRGLALSIHGMGGNLGNAIGPLGLGILIGAIAWQSAARFMAIPILFLAVVLWLALRNVSGREGRSVGTKQYIAAIKGLLRNKVLMGLVISGGIRGMGTGSIFAFFSLYCQEDLQFSTTKAGLYFTLMMASGIASQPVMGYLSDRVGRKMVLVPSLVLMGAFDILLVWAGTGVGLMLVAVCIGLFIYSIGAVIQAAAMDVTPEQTGAMTIGLLFGSSFLFTTPSPTIAGALASAFGTPSVFLYSGSLILLSAVIVSFLPIRGARRASET
jgi:MFS family permease